MTEVPVPQVGRMLEQSRYSDTHHTICKQIMQEEDTTTYPSSRTNHKCLTRHLQPQHHCPGHNVHHPLEKPGDDAARNARSHLPASSHLSP
jgi:hypothetical protein